MTLTKAQEFDAYKQGVAEGVFNYLAVHRDARFIDAAITDGVRWAVSDMYVAGAITDGVRAALSEMYIGESIAQGVENGFESASACGEIESGTKAAVTAYLAQHGVGGSTA